MMKGTNTLQQLLSFEARHIGCPLLELTHHILKTTHTPLKEEGEREREGHSEGEGERMFEPVY